MQLLETIATLETFPLTRDVTTARTKEILTYRNETGTTKTITLNNETEIPNVMMVCLDNRNNTNYIYISYSKTGNYKKFQLSEMTSISMT